MFRLATPVPAVLCWVGRVRVPRHPRQQDIQGKGWKLDTKGKKTRASPQITRKVILVQGEANREDGREGQARRRVAVWITTFFTSFEWEVRRGTSSSEREEVRVQVRLQYKLGRVFFFSFVLC